MPKEQDTPERRRVNAYAAEIKRRGLSVRGTAVYAAQAAQEIAQRGIGAKVYKTFRDYVSHRDPDILKYEHLPKLLDVADRILDRTLTHVMIWAPPRYYKSHIFSRLLPGYYLHHHPAKIFALVSHAAHLAWELSEAARENYVASGGLLSSETASRARWQTAHTDEKGRQGEMWAQGMGAGIIGKGFDLGGVDDPIHPDHAFSWTWRKKFETWWENTWLRARNPGAQMFVVMQRLGMDDPIDYLLQQELTGRALNWHVVCLDEVHSDEPLGKWSGPKGLPPSCTLEPDWRKTGEILAPSLFPPALVKERQNQSTPYVVAAQRQQRPMRATGDFWQAEWFKSRTYDVLPKEAFNGGYDWDTAFSSDEHNSATAMVKSYRGPAPDRDRPNEFDVYIDDLDFRWVEFPALVKWMLSLGGPHHVEEKASGKSAVQQLRAFKVVAKEVPVKGDKLMRASGVQPHVSAGRVYVNSKVAERLLWADQQGLLRVTAEQLQEGGSTDLNDAFVQALHRHLGIHQEPARKLVFG